MRLSILVCVDESSVILEVAAPEDRLPLLKDLASQLPQSPGVFWNLGLAAAQTGDEPLALAAYSHYRLLALAERRGFYKLIQTYQALGRLKERERAGQKHRVRTDEVAAIL